MSMVRQQGTAGVAGASRHIPTPGVSVHAACEQEGRCERGECGVPEGSATVQVQAEHVRGRHGVIRD